MPADEAALLIRAREGDRQALQSLLATYYDRLLAYVARLVSRTNYSHVISVEDIVQETYARAFASRSLDALLDGNPDHNFMGWLSTIARNAFTDKVRRPPVVSIHRGPAKSSTGPGTDVVDPDSDPDLAPTVELPARMLAALDSLSPEHREVIELVYFEGLTPREAAKKLDLPFTTFNGRLFRSKEKLRAHLQRLSLYI